MFLGGVIACGLGGFAVFQTGGALWIDWIGKVIFDAVAILWLVAPERTVVGRSGVFRGSKKAGTTSDTEKHMRKLYLMYAASMLWARY